MNLRNSKSSIVATITPSIIPYGKKSDIRVAKSEEKLDFYLLPDSIISVDRASIDFEWLYSLDQRHVWFVTRAKTSMQYRIVGQHQPIDHPQVTRDDEIELIVEKPEKNIQKPFV